MEFPVTTLTCLRVYRALFRTASSASLALQISGESPTSHQNVMATIASPAMEDDIEDASEVVKSKPHAFRPLQQNEGENEPESEGQRAGLTTSPRSPNGEIPNLESVNLNVPRSNSDSDGSGSQTVLLRDRSGRESGAAGLESLRLSSRIDFTQTDTFKVSGKTCTVTLEEDRITWAPKKASGKNIRRRLRSGMRVSL